MKIYYRRAACIAAFAASLPQAQAEPMKQDLQYALLLGLAAAPPAVHASPNVQMEGSLSAGYRQDRLNWSIAGTSVGTNPNILSELSWDNLNIAQLRAGGKITYKNDWVMRGAASYGEIITGRNQDSDYLGDNRTMEFSRSNNKAGGNVRDASLGVGHTFRFFDKTVGKFINLTPLAGYSLNQQNLIMTDGYQTWPPTGAFPGLNTTYNAEWKGPWVGMDAWLQAGPKLAVIASLEYHWVDYSAEANWNLRDEFARPLSFTHYARGNGYTASLGGSYSIARSFLLNVTLEHRKWTTDPGKDVTYFADGKIGHTQFNQANWESMAAMVEAVVRF
ncbi:MAG: TonB-dependent receptor [Gammaproteobacteria bacterium]